MDMPKYHCEKYSLRTNSGYAQASLWILVYTHGDKCDSAVIPGYIHEAGEEDYSEFENWMLMSRPQFPAKSGAYPLRPKLHR